MANEVALTVAQIAPIPSSLGLEIYSYKCTVAVAKGEAVYFVTASNGIALADGNGSGTLQFRGIALQAGAIGQWIDVQKRGLIAGFTVSALAYDDILYLSDTVGDLSTAAGSTTVNCGRVVGMADKDGTKVVYIDADWLRDWS